MAKSKVWQMATIDEERKLLKAHLESAHSPKVRLSKITTFIVESLSNTTEIDSLRAYLGIMYALIHQSQHGGLKENEVKRFLSLARGILGTAKVGSKTSTLGFLYADLYHILSQIYRDQGHPTEAAWTEHLALYYGRQATRDNPGLYFLSLGIRQLRMGDSKLALAYLHNAEAIGLEARSLIRGRIEQLRGLRFLGDFKTAEALNAKTQAMPELNKHEAQEIEWETLLRETTQDGAVSRLVKACKPKKSHNEFSYTSEAFLWSRLTSETQWIEEFPRVTSFGSRPKTKKDSFFKVTDILVDCYDKDIPFTRRMENLGDTLMFADSLFTVDKEALIWGAASRWFARSHSDELLNFCLTQYRAISRRLSAGASPDVFGLLDGLSVQIPDVPLPDPELS